MKIYGKRVKQKLFEMDGAASEIIRKRIANRKYPGSEIITGHCIKVFQVLSAIFTTTFGEEYKGYVKRIQTAPKCHHSPYPEK